ncbi:MAG: flavin reductase [Peptoniphilaceae bacterium]|nr:flavin reductase [Peptoniphilaceae bacterium]
MIKNQWYAVLPSKAVKNGHLVSVKRLGMDLVFFRNDAGTLGCVSDQCPHRGASLGGGKVENNCVRCPFHGLEFATDGTCTFVPALGKATTEDLSIFNVKAYSVREQFGIIYLWYGDDEKKTEALPFFYDHIHENDIYSELADPWSTHYSRAIENQLDVVHVPIVHWNSIGRGDKTLVNGPKVLWDGHLLQTSADNEKDHGQTPRKPENSVIKETNLNFLFPNLWLNHISDKMLVMIYFAPVDDENTMMYIRFYSKMTGVRLIDRFIAWTGKYANKFVERQDRRVVITQKPKATSLQMGETLLQGDGPVIKYRMIRDQLIRENGGGLSEESQKAADKEKKEEVHFASPMHTLSYGLHVLTVVDENHANACIINTAIQAASKPNLMSISVEKSTATHDMIHEGGYCTVSVLSEEAPFELFQRFGFQSGTDVDKFDGFDAWEETEHEQRYITEGTNAYFLVSVTDAVDAGSHTIFVGEVEKMEVLNDVASATYDYYQSEIKPQPEAVGRTEDGQTIWRCRVCGYEYVGDELPDDFVCPVCKHPAYDFEKVGE